LSPSILVTSCALDGLIIPSTGPLPQAMQVNIYPLFTQVREPFFRIKISMTMLMSVETGAANPIRKRFVFGRRLKRKVAGTLPRKVAIRFWIIFDVVRPHPFR